uniref:Peptidase S1 domain-containing protein n=1 Tax=Anopheles farauti TaxID=69004 RepID=A0A182QIR7_9DIPT
MALIPWCTVCVVLLWSGAAVASVIVDSHTEMSCTTNANTPGICVYQYQCNGGVITQSGENVIDVRHLMDDCRDYMMVCCAVPMVGTTEEDHDRVKDPNRSTTTSPTDATEAAADEMQTELPTTPRTVLKRPKVPIPPYEELGGCGHRNPSGVIFTIENNQLSEAEYGEYPWSVAIFTRDEAGLKYRCGGALIDRAAVLTTASCLYRYRFQVSSLVVRLGEWDMSTDSEPLPHVDAEVEKVHLHPHFRESSKINDIALVVLSETIELNHTIGVVCLPPASFDFHQQDVIGVGWGEVPRFVEKRPQTILKKSHLRRIAHDTCQTTLRQMMGRQYRLDGGFLCADAQGTEMLPCTGDTGSPYVAEIVPGQERYYLVGLASWGYDCNRQTFPTVMTNVAKYRAWIDDMIRREELDERSYLYEEPVVGEDEED